MTTVDSLGPAEVKDDRSTPLVGEGNGAEERSTRTGPRHCLRRPRSLFDWWIVGLVVFGIADRYYFYTAPFGVPDSDEAVGVLMAQGLLHGHATAFMWGQAYGGPLESWLAAPIIGIFGPSWLGLRLIPILLSAATSVVVWRIGLRTISARGAVTAAALSWVFPTSLLWKTTHFHIFYASSMLLGTFVVLQVTRLYEQPSRRGMLVLGLLAGVGLWQSFQLMTIVPTAILWLLIRRRDTMRLLPTTIVGALIGLVPVIGSNLKHDFWSYDIGHPGNTVPYTERVWRFFTYGLPQALDLRAPVTLHWFLWKPIGIFLYLVVLAGFAWLVWAQWKGRRGRPFELLLVIAAVFPLVYALSPLTTFIYHAGYVVVLMPILSLLVVSWVRSEEQAVIVSALAVVLMSASTIGLDRAYANSRSAYDFGGFGDHAPLPRDFGPLMKRLDELSIRRVYASYWIAYRLTYESGGRIVASEMRPEALRITSDGVVIPKPNDPDLRSRAPQYAPVVARVTAPALVIAKGFDVGSTDYGSLEAARYKVNQVGAFTIYHSGPLSRGMGSRP